MTWRPLFAGDAASPYREAARGIADRLSTIDESAWIASRRAEDDEDDVRARAVDLASGRAGLAVFHAYTHAVTGQQAYLQHSLACLDAALERASSARMPPGLFSGFAGVAWAATHVHQRWVNDEEDPVEAADEMLLELLDRQMWTGPCDLVAGLVGYGVYALERWPRAAAMDVLGMVVDRLDDLSEQTPDGLAWRTAPSHVASRHPGEFPDGYYDLGVAHGVPGIIAFLSRVCRHELDAERDVKARRLLAGAAAWLLTQLRRHPGATLPYFTGPAIEATEPARVAWCYGAPGVALALLDSARSLEDEECERAAIDLALAATEVSRERSRIDDAALCHGASGVAHLFHRLYLATGEEKLGQAARLWFERTLSLLHTEAASAEADTWAEPGVLLGPAGTGLALLAATSTVTPAWARILLVDEES